MIINKNSKNKYKKILLIFFSFFTLTGYSFSNPITTANAQSQKMKVLKHYYFDRNKFTGSFSKERGHRYIYIPTWCRPAGSSDIIVGHGWNYHTIQRIFYFTGGW